MKLLSIAIPCYNSQDYMRHAVESALAGGEDVEILIVNDGSTDKTLSIINEWALKDKRIKKRDRIALYSTIFGFSFYKFVWKLYKKLTGREK